jgi:predicted RNase H-like HicB family nuclease
MRSTTFKFVVHGDSYEELVQKADATIEKFLDEDLDEFEDENGYKPQQTTNYEMIVSKNDIDDDFEYSAEVITRIKDVR